MSKKLTHEEHHARAMLMGMKFLPWSNAYIRDSTETFPITPWHDADTLEPLDLDEVSRRIQKTLAEDPFENLDLVWG